MIDINYMYSFIHPHLIMRLNFGAMHQTTFYGFRANFCMPEKSSTNHLSSATKQADVIGIPEFDKKFPSRI